MIRLPLRAILLRSLVLAFALGPSSLAAQVAARPQVGVTWDFETGDLRGWTGEGTAFQGQPVPGASIVERGGEPPNQQGTFLVSTYHPTRGEALTGTLSSAPFPITGGRLSFLVGGGSAFETRVELEILDPLEGAIRVELASGENREAMRRVEWDLSEYAGREGRIRIVDEGSGPWGHINADDFRFGAVGQGAPPEEGPITVPDLRGRPVGEADALLAQAGLLLVRGRDVPSDAPRGTVVGQTPAPGSAVDRGARVVVDVATWVVVPMVTEGGIEPARRMLVEGGLRLGEVARRFSATAPGTILSQDPPAGTEVPAGTAVNVAMSVWPTVPDLTGLDSVRARSVLESDSLRLGGVSIRPSRSRRGTVVGQTPPSGRELPPRSLVQIEVAGGVAVPNVYGMAGAEAAARLSRDTLPVGRQTPELSRQPVGTVIRQSPAADSMVLAGTAVDLWIAEGVPVPELAGVRLQEAQNRLRDGRLTLGEVGEEASSEPIGTVIGQNPAPGSTVPLEAPVGLTLAQGVPVPALQGIARLAARQRLEAGGLAEGAITMQRSTSPPGTVLGQSPAPGELLPLESPVDLLLAEGVPVPSLFGLDSSRAHQRLSETGLELAGMEAEPSPAPMGSVIRQLPVADEVVALATPVQVVLAEGVPVPDLYESPTEDARGLLDSQGLAFRSVDRRWSLAATGAVLEQNPPAGTLVPLETAVEVVVARHIPAGWILAVTALLGGALLLLNRRKRSGVEAVPAAVPGRRRKKKKEKKGKESTAPKRETPGVAAGVTLEVRGEPDPGVRAFEGGDAPEVAFELRWRLVRDPGRRATNLQGSGIAGERIKRNENSQEPNRG